MKHTGQTRARRSRSALLVRPRRPKSALPNSEEYRGVGKDAKIASYTLDLQGRICELNEKGANMIGFTASWLLGRAFVVFVAKHDVRRFLGFLRESTRIPDQAKTIVLDMCTDQMTYPVQITVTTSSFGSARVHRMTVTDQTEVRRSQNLRQQTLASWYSLVHNAPDTIMTVDRAGRITFVNKPLWGESITSVIGTNLLDHVPEISRHKLKSCLREAFDSEKRTACELTGLNGDWSRWYSFGFGSPEERAKSPLTTTTTTTLMIREISEHKRTEESLRTSGEQMRDFAARIDAVREEERTRVAREIHDELGQALTALKLDLAWVQSKMAASADARKKMKEMIEHVDDTIERVRRISSELRPSVLDDLGLVPAIEWQVSQFRKRTRIRTEFTCKADGLDLPSEAAIAVFRVVQEALTNVIRHAKATRVRIVLETMEQAVRISISDNGKGITATEENDMKSLGIVGMKERISRLGGQLNVISGPGKGTRLDIGIPTQYDQSMRR